MPTSSSSTSYLSHVWSWRYEDSDGRPVRSPSLPDGQFPSQADAETWVGQVWRDLLGQGVDAVSLFAGEDQVYGPMSLHPAE